MNAPTTRVFHDAPAIRKSVPLLIGLMGPSGSGKTYSALRLATGIQTVTGGDIFVIDTEAGRATAYADYFTFRHVPFDAPFGSLDYLAAIKHCVAKGAGVIVIDSMSHEHEGPGGLLDMHEQELDRLAGNNASKRETMNMLAWQKPKAHRRQLRDALTQLRVNFVFCFRAKETAKPMKVEGKMKVVQLGYMPIAGDEFVFEMTVNCLLLPGAGGVPTWATDNVGERSMMKLPEQFKGIFRERQPLSEAIGHDLAQWAKGDKAYEALLDEARKAARGGTETLRSYWKGLSAADRQIVSGIQVELSRLRDLADNAQPEPEPEAVDDSWLEKPAPDGPAEPAQEASEPDPATEAADEPDEPHDPETGELPALEVTSGFEEWFARISAEAYQCETLEALERWHAEVKKDSSTMIPPDQDAVEGLYQKHVKRLEGGK